MDTNTQTEILIPSLIIRDGQFVSEKQNQEAVKILNENFDWLVQLRKIFFEKNKDKKHAVIACINIQNQKGQNLAERFTHGKTFPPEKSIIVLLPQKKFSNLVLMNL